MPKKPQIVVDPTTLPGQLVHAQNATNATDTPFDETQVESAKEEGRMEATKEISKEGKKNINKLDALLDKSTDVLIHVKNIVPMLKSEVLVHTTKITVIHRPFIFSERIHSVTIKDVSDVYIDTGPFFATLNIVDVGFVENLVSVKWLRKSHAERARRIITGLQETSKMDIDTEAVEEKGEALAKKLEEIGKIRETNTSVSNA